MTCPNRNARLNVVSKRLLEQSKSSLIGWTDQPVYYAIGKQLHNSIKQYKATFVWTQIAEWQGEEPINRSVNRRSQHIDVKLD